MMRNPTAALLLLSAATAQAQIRPAIQGRVFDAKSRAPIAGAEVSSDGITVRSTNDGIFRIEHLGAGSHTLRIRKIGFATQTVAAQFPSDDVLVPLVESARELNALVVTAARREQKLKDVVVSTELVSRDRIDASGASDIAQVLTEQNGVQFTGGHPAGSSISLEGLSDQRVLILIDGLPYYGRIAGGQDLTSIPASIVERVEIVKGPQSTLYGSEAMGGVVNIITRRPVGGRSTLDLRQTVGSDRRSDSDISTTFAAGRLSAAGVFAHRYVERTPGIAAPAGALADHLDGMFSGAIAASKALSFDGSILALNDRQRWLSGSLFQFADNTQLNGRLGSSYVTGASSLTGSIYYTQLDHLSRASAYTKPIANTGDRQKQRLEQADIIYSHRAAHTVFDAGTQFRHEFISSTDGRIPGGSRTLNSAEPYAQLELSGSRWAILPGSRLSWSEQFGTAFTPRIAARFQAAPSLTLRASVGRGYRAPDFKELYLDFSNNAAFYAVHGNASLDPETSDNVSADAEWDGSRVYARVHAYSNTLHNFIETQAIGMTGNFAQYTYGNISSGSTRGAELSGGTTFASIRTELGYAFLRAIDNGTGGELLGQPKHSARALLSREIANTQFSAITVYTGKTPLQRSATGSVSTYRDAYTKVDVRAAHTFLDRYRLSAGLDNLFDAAPAGWADVTRRQVYVSAGWQAMGGR